MGADHETGASPDRCLRPRRPADAAGRHRRGLPVPRPTDMMGTYNKRYPDGLASFSRLMVRDMIPEVAPAPIARSRQEAILTAAVDQAHRAVDEQLSLR